MQVLIKKTTTLMVAVSMFCLGSVRAENDFSARPGHSAHKTETGRTLIDGIVAEVDAMPILHSQIEEKVQHGPLIKVSAYPLKGEASAYERALQDEINLQLIMRKTRELDIEVDDAKVDEHINRIISDNKLTKEALIQFLAQQGKSFSAYRQDIRDQMLMMHFRGRVLMPLVKITERDVENYYVKKTGTMAEAINLHLYQHVFAEQEAAELFHSQLVAGKDFSQLVRERTGAAASEPFVVKLRDLAQGLREELAELEEGQYSRPIAMAGAYHVFMLARKDFADSGGYRAHKEALEQELRQEEITLQLERWLESERAKTKVNRVHGE